MKGVLSGFDMANFVLATLLLFLKKNLNFNLMVHVNSYFSTLTINGWISLFEDFSDCIDILYESFVYMVNEKSVSIYAFVVMKDHLHIIWKSKYDNIDDVTSSLKKFTGRKFLYYLRSNDTSYLDENFLSKRKDRNYKFWKSNSSNFLIQHSEIFRQKMDYIHYNPVKGDYKVCAHPGEYYNSSFNSYETMESQFPFLTLGI